MTEQRKREKTKIFFETIQANYISGNSCQFYKIINSDRTNINPKIIYCKDTQGNLLTESQANLDRQVEHFNQLLNGSGSNENLQRKVPQGASEPTLETLEFRQLNEAITRVKKHKAPGTDEIPTELYKHMDHVTLRHMFKVVQQAWQLQ